MLNPLTTSTTSTTQITSSSAKETVQLDFNCRQLKSLNAVFFLGMSFSHHTFKESTAFVVGVWGGILRFGQVSCLNAFSQILLPAWLSTYTYIYIYTILHGKNWDLSLSVRKESGEINLFQQGPCETCAGWPFARCLTHAFELCTWGCLTLDGVCLT